MSDLQADDAERKAQGRDGVRQVSRYLDWSRGCVYYIGSPDNGRMKIGYTKGAPGKRLRALQTGSSTKLYLFAVHPGTQETEQKLHRQFSADRLHGEWFEASDELLAHLAGTCGLMIAIHKSEGLDPPQWAVIGLNAIISMCADDRSETVQ